MDFSERVKMWRHEIGMSQQQFADYLEIPVDNIRKWEQGVNTPRDYVIKWLLRILKSENPAKKFN